AAPDTLAALARQRQGPYACAAVGEVLGPDDPSVDDRREDGRRRRACYDTRLPRRRIHRVYAPPRAVDDRATVGRQRLRLTACRRQLGPFWRPRRGQSF